MDFPGLSFSPFNQSPMRSNSQATAPVQDAIKILSFRMPSVVGSSAPAPGALLGGPTPQGSGMDGGLAQELLKRLLQGQGTAPVPGMPTPGVPGGPSAAPMSMPGQIGAGASIGASLPQGNPFLPMGAGQTSTPAPPDNSSPLPASFQFQPQDTNRPPDPTMMQTPAPMGGGGMGGRQGWGY